MNRKSKPKTNDKLPQEDRYVPTIPQRLFSLLPRQHNGSRSKGKPISMPTVQHDQPKPRYKHKNTYPRPTGISIDRCDRSLVYDIDPPVSTSKIVNSMKNSDESKRKAQQKAQIRDTFAYGSTKPPLTQTVTSTKSKTPAKSKAAKPKVVVDLRPLPKPTKIVVGDKHTPSRSNNTEQKGKQPSTSRFDSLPHDRNIHNYLAAKGIDMDKTMRARMKRDKSSGSDGDSDNNEAYYSANSSLSATDDSSRSILPKKSKRLKRSHSKGTPISIPSISNEEPPSIEQHSPGKKIEPAPYTTTSPAPVELSDEETCDASDAILFTYPLDRSKGSITISKEDRNRLEPGQFLNDSVIDFYLKWLMDFYTHGYGSARAQQDTKYTYIFSSFFYNRLTQGMTIGGQVKYENVRKWTTDIDLFEKKYAIFPINEKWHWYLVLVCNIDNCIPNGTSGGPRSKNRPFMFVLDSLGGRQKASMIHLTNYLLKEAVARRNVDPEDFIRPLLIDTNVPRQDNSCDCGVFLLHFVDKFLNFPQEFMNILLTDDARHPKWKEHDIKDKRKDIQILFRKMHRMYKMQYNTNNS